MKASVIIPTYNRGPALAATAAAVLDCDANGLDAVEICVVDDGSAVPAREHLAGLRMGAPFSLEVVRQPNAGPGAARNTGFKHTSHRLVVCIDDDILVPPDTLRKCCEALRERPGCVICGECAFEEGPAHPQLRAFLQARALDGRRPGSVPRATGYCDRTTIASGVIVFDRELFRDGLEFYGKSLLIMGDEFVFSGRLRRHGVPIVHAAWIGGVHCQPVTPAFIARQHYGHGRGLGRAVAEFPADLMPEMVEQLQDANGYGPNHTLRRRLTKPLRAALRTASGRAALLRAVESLDRIALPRRLKWLAYDFLISVNHLAGFRDGLDAAAARAGEA